jgi:hypothetical protein
LLCRWLMGDYGFTFMAGFMVSYASYLWVHYLLSSVLGHPRDQLI